MDRRRFLMVSLALTLKPRFSAAQEPKVGRTAAVGYLGSSSPSLEAAHVAAFREGLRQLGYVEGQNLSITFRWAAGDEKRFAVLARELVHLKPDVILTARSLSTRMRQSVLEFSESAPPP